MPRKTDSSNPAHWLAIAEDELACVRVLAAFAVAGRAAVADLATLARSGRPGRGILAPAVAFGTRADRARTNVRLNGHEKLLFLC